MRKRWLTLALSAVVATSAGFAAVGDAVANSGRDAVAPERPTRKQPYDKILKTAIKDIQDYWSQVMPEVFGVAYDPIPASRIIPYDQRTSSGDFGDCSDPSSTYEDNANNAFYCVLDDAVRYDNGTLFPDIYNKYDHNPFGIAVVMAHEWGHAIQARFLTIDEFVNTPTILKEQQADCFAGAWVEYVDSGKSRSLQLDPGDLDIGISGMLDVRDQVGSAPTDEGAHGSGFDRVGAFEQGYEGGAQGCSDLLNNPRPIVQIPFTTASAALRGGNAPYDEDLFTLTRDDLDLYWSQFTELQPYDSVDDIIPYDVTRKRSLPVCKAQGLKPTKPKAYANSVFYCGGNDDYIAFDNDLMAGVYDNTGDFGVATLIANAWASAMQQRLDQRGDVLTLGLQADCFTGSWTGSIPIDDPPTTNARGLAADRDSTITLEPGDLDEVVQAFLVFADPAEAAHPVRGTAFQRIQAFRLGFFSTTPEADCLTITE